MDLWSAKSDQDRPSPPKLCATSDVRAIASSTSVELGFVPSFRISPRAHTAAQHSKKVATTQSARRGVSSFGGSLSAKQANFIDPSAAGIDPSGCTDSQLIIAHTSTALRTPCRASSDRLGSQNTSTSRAGTTDVNGDEEPRNPSESYCVELVEASFYTRLQPPASPPPPIAQSQSLAQISSERSWRDASSFMQWGTMFHPSTGPRNINQRGPHLDHQLNKGAREP